jgi:poly(A) polymerase
MPAVAADPESARRFAIQVVSRLREAGHEALWAGGCVRDQLLGRTPADFDVATSAHPDAVRELFGRRRTLAVGAAFGVITVVGPQGAGHVEVTTFRTDAAYTDGRHPAGVRFSTPQEDAQRRDFTINGLFFDPLEGKVHDYVGGQADLAEGVVRAIGVASQRFAEDHLRMLRAVRFSAGFGFILEADTRSAIERMASRITIVSPERIAAELRLMIARPGRTAALDLLLDTGLAAEVLPEVALPDAMPIPTDRWRLASRVVGALDEPALPAALAMLVDVSQPPATLPDQAGPPGRRPHSRTITAISDRLRLSNEETTTADWLLIAFQTLDRLAGSGGLAKAPWSTVQPWLADQRAWHLADLMRARADHGLGMSDTAAWVTAQLKRPPHALDPPPLLSGHDLLAAKVATGREIGRWLAEVRKRQLDDQLATKEEALAWITTQASPDATS